MAAPPLQDPEDLGSNLCSVLPLIEEELDQRPVGGGGLAALGRSRPILPGETPPAHAPRSDKWRDVEKNDRVSRLEPEVHRGFVEPIDDPRLPGKLLSLDLLPLRRRRLNPAGPPEETIELDNARARGFAHLTGDRGLAGPAGADHGDSRHVSPPGQA